MKRQQIVLIVCGSLMAVICLGAAWFLFSAMTVKNVAADERNQAYGELRKIYAAKVFPSDENIARLMEDEKTLEKWLSAASELVHKGDLKIETNSPAVFKQSLQSTVRALSAHPGTIKGKVVGDGFKFGFDKYLGESDSLPDKEHVWRLTQQLAVIEKVCSELYAANILSLDTVEREIFDEQDEGRKLPEETGRKRRRREDTTVRASKASAASSSGQTSEFFSKQRFTFVFTARPDAFVEALNRLAATDLFMVVEETEFHKVNDPLTKRDTKKKDKEDAAADAASKVDLATVPHIERIVSDPELEPPVSVKLDIDVFSFEGV